MAYRYGQRKQTAMLPASIEDYVGGDAPVRAYDAFVEALDFKRLGILEDADQEGCPRYEPKAMMKLLVYGYSYGVRSSRKLEREAHYNLSFIWLMGGLKPDHKTIAEFRRGNRGALAGVLRQCARMCMGLGLIAGNTLFVDGSKVRANASVKNSWTKEKCRKVLRKVDRRIEEIIKESEGVDAAEAGEGSLVRMREELKGKQALRERVAEVMAELERSGEAQINTTDRDSKVMRSLQGKHASYNVQSVVDEKHGLIVSGDVVGENNDSGQFAKQVQGATEVLGKACQVACADSGYANTEELEKAAKENIRVIVPSQEQALHGEKKPFLKSEFRYDREGDYYLCPEGQRLRYRGWNRRKRMKVYNVASGTCQACRHFGVCTKSREGRKVTRLHNEEMKEAFETEYARPESQAIYRLRKQKVELPFGHIKKNLGVGGFLLRGRAGVKAEWSLLASCFNVARMITLLGVPGILAELRGG